MIYEPIQFSDPSFMIDEEIMQLVAEIFCKEMKILELIDNY